MQAILIGFMGSGKTTVGQLLATELGTHHADLDDMIVQRAGKTISAIFEERGEAYFRQLEQQTLRDAIAQPGILSTGGGTPTIAANAAILKASPVPVICLTASDQTILGRVAQDTGRPLVDELGSQGLMALKQKRAALYRAAADVLVATDNLTPEQIVAEIKARILRPVHRLAANG